MSKLNLIERRDGSVRRTALMALCGSVAIGLATAPAAAQESEGEIVVTAQKREESVQKVPISIAVLGGATLDKQTAGGALEAVTAIPGISAITSQAGNQTSVSIRGVSPAGTFGGGTSTVGYYLDTIPFQLARNSMVPNAKVYDLSRIEVLRGPQGTLYGAGSLNGVVRVLTHDADTTQFLLKTRAGMSFTEGGDPSFRADAALNIPLIEDKLAVRLIGGLESAGGWIDQPRRNKRNANSTHTENFRAKVAVTPTDDFRIDLTAWFSRDHYDAQAYAQEDRAVISPGAQTATQKHPGDTNFDAYNAKITYDLPFVSVSSATSYLKYHQRLFTDQTNLNTLAAAQGFAEFHSDVFTEELLFNSAGTGPLRWSAGLFYRNGKDDRFQRNPGLPGLLYWIERSESYAAFGQLTGSFADGRLEVTGGLRYFHEKTSVETPPLAGGYLPVALDRTKNEKVTPRVVVTWLPSRNLTFYASYSQGFRGGLTQMPIVTVVTALPKAGSDTLTNYEIGTKGSAFEGLVSFELAGYYIDWQDTQTTSQVPYGLPDQFVAALINGPSASGFGTDISLTLEPMKGFQLGGSYSYNDLTFDGDVIDRGVVVYPAGSRLAMSPKWGLSSFVNYRFPLSSSLTGRLNISYNLSAAGFQRLRGTASLTATANNPTPPNCFAQGGNAVCYTDKRRSLDATFEIASDSGKTLSIYAQNLTNFDGLLMPAFTYTGKLRPRPRTIGLQFEAKF